MIPLLLAPGNFISHVGLPKPCTHFVNSSFVKHTSKKTTEVHLKDEGTIKYQPQSTTSLSVSFISYWDFNWYTKKQVTIIIANIYYVPGILLNSLHTLIHLMLTSPLWRIPPLQIWNLRYRESKWFPKVIASEGLNQNSDLQSCFQSLCS